MAPLPMSNVARAVEVEETHGFLKAVVDTESGEIPGLMAFALEDGEIMAAMKIAMMSPLPFTTLRDGIFAHPTLAESFNNLFASLDSSSYRRDLTMEMTPEKAVSALLKETKAAHAAYETKDLGGVFDEEWPAWYATYLIDHGLGDRLPAAESLNVANLAAMLAQLAVDYEQGDKAAPWPDVYARGIVAEVRQRS